MSKLVSPSPAADCLSASAVSALGALSSDGALIVSVLGMSILGTVLLLDVRSGYVVLNCATTLRPVIRAGQLCSVPPLRNRYLADTDLTMTRPSPLSMS